MKKVNYKELAYKSTGPILQVSGASYMIYGLVTGKPEAVGEGFLAFLAGRLTSMRTEYVTEKFNEIGNKISELEGKLK